MLPIRKLLCLRALYCPSFRRLTSRTGLTPHLSAYRVLEHEFAVKNTTNVSVFDMLIAERKPAYKAVVFDKDGTLVCFHSLWLPWARHIANSVSEAVQLDVAEDIFSLLGVCSKTQRISPGLLAEGTKAQISSAVAQLLVNRGVDQNLAISVSERYVSYWSSSPEHLKQLHNLGDLFTVLRQHGILIGICTSDSRLGTLRSLDTLDLLHLVDLTICGDDPDGRPKPDPHNAHLICDRFGIQPEEAVMVGDTPTDVLFAKHGNFGLAVGVLSGIGQRSDLERAWYGTEKTASTSDDPEDAQSHSRQFHIIPSVADIIPLVLPNSSIPIRSTVATTTTITTAGKPASSTPGNDMIRLIILSKNGTLTSVHPRWSVWAEQLCANLSEKTSSQVANQFSEILGYSPETRRAVGGLLVDSSILHIKECLGYLLMLSGYGLNQAEKLLNEIWFEPELEPTDVISGVASTIKELKDKELFIAINSSDTRDACQAFLDHTQLHKSIDLICSAEDADRHPKPLPHTVHRIMDTLGCKPEQTMVVGASPADLLSGRAAGVRLTVGVLSGFSLAHNLIAYANLLVPNATYLPHVIKLDSMVFDSPTN